MCNKQFFIKCSKEIYMCYIKKAHLEENSILGQMSTSQSYVGKYHGNIKYGFNEEYDHSKRQGIVVTCVPC